AKQDDCYARSSANEGGGEHASAQPARAQRERRAQARARTDDRAFECTGHARRRMAEQQVERVDAKELDDSANKKPARSAANEGPAPVPLAHVSCDRDPETDP